MPTLWRWSTLGGVAIGVALIAGCSRDNVAREVAAMNASNIQRVANVYAAFQHYRGRGPNDEAEFKTFIKEFMPKNLEMMGIDPNNIDKIFTSERDGKPLKVRYKAGGGRGAVVAVAFEQEGKGGKKQVGFTGGKIETADDATVQKMWAGKVDATPSQQSGRPAGAPTGAPKGSPGK